MSELPKLQVDVGDLLLLGHYWAQIGLNSPLVLGFVDSNVSVKVCLEEFDEQAAASVSVVVSEDKSSLILTIRHAKKIPFGGIGSTGPLVIGQIAGHEAYLSYLAVPFGDSVNIDISLYWKKQGHPGGASNGS